MALWVDCWNIQKKMAATKNVTTVPRARTNLKRRGLAGVSDLIFESSIWQIFP
jgi:hypothetical protein